MTDKRGYITKMTDAEFLQYSKTLREKALPNDAKGPIGDLIDAFRARVDELELRLNEADCAFAEAEQHIRKLEAAQEWRPIETMPMDGTLVLLYISYNGLSFFRLGYRYSKDGPWHPEPPSNHCPDVLYRHATRWRPLSDLPEEK
jgi:hypothetical protein